MKQFEILNSKSYKVSLLQCVLVFFVIALIIHLFFPVFTLFKQVITLLWFVLFIFFSCFYFPLRYKKQCYVVEKDILIIVNGVFFEKTNYIPLIKIQHTTTSFDFLMRLFSLANFKVVTPGGQVRLFKIDLQECRRLEKLISGYINQQKGGADYA